MSVDSIREVVNDFSVLYGNNQTETTTKKLTHLKLCINVDCISPVPRTHTGYIIYD